MVEPVLSVNGLSSGYGKTCIVENVSFDIFPGEIFGLVGLNGAGKTTLIKTILGLRQKTAGDVSSVPEQISYLPERFNPPWFLSGYDFIRFSLRLYKKDISLQDAEKAAENISLDPECLKKNVRTYSKGMRQKIGLLATILTECSLIVLDEPMSGLDPKARQDVKKIILQAKRDNRAVLMCSHILADVSELCDKVAVFDKKNLVFNGTPAELQEEGGDPNLEKAFLGVLAA